MYRRLTLLGKNIIAIPDISYRDRLFACTCYPAISWRQKIVKAFLLFIMLIGLDKLFFLKVSLPHDQINESDWNRFVQRLQGSFGQVVTIITYPSDSKRKRLYVYVVRDRKVLSFIKYAFDGTDMKLLHEAEYLSESENVDMYKMPNLLMNEMLGSDHFIMTEALPSKGKYLNRNWSAIKALSDAIHIEKRKKAINSLKWYPEMIEALNTINNKDVLEMLDRYETIEVCRVHGDFHNMNIYVSHNTWIIDWEATSIDGPILTDELAFFLNEFMSNSLFRKGDILTEFQRRFYRKEQYHEIDIVFALLFLAVQGREDALNLLNVW